MDYNDFPILDDDKYQLIQSQYENFLPFNRKDNVNKIYLLLEECRHLCFGLTKQYNANINRSIFNTLHELERVMDNFNSTFSIKLDYKKQISEFNLFQFLKKLIECVKEISLWNLKEDKVYYKKFSHDNHIIILNCVYNLVSVLENSNIRIFKFM